MLRPLITLTLGVTVATLVVPQPGRAQACAYVKGLSQSVGSTSFLEGGTLPLGLGAGAVAIGAVGVTLWQRQRRANASTRMTTPASQVELNVVLPESEATVSSKAEDATLIA
ncbi:hypothetical protein [Parathermosynechococcus lividus]